MIDNDARDVMVTDNAQILLADRDTGGSVKKHISTVLMLAAWIGVFVLYLIVRPG